MNQVQSPATSVTYAAKLLDAWERGDLAGLRGRLNSTLRSEPAADVPGLECERRELVNGIAESMRDALAHNIGVTAGCEMEISLQLLRHVAKRVNCG